MHNNKQLAVLITGAGSGMGLHKLQNLELKGHKVYAGIRESAEIPISQMK